MFVADILHLLLVTVNSHTLGYRNSADEVMGSSFVICVVYARTKSRTVMQGETWDSTLLVHVFRS